MTSQGHSRRRYATYCINLQDRPERRTSAIRYLNKLKIRDPIFPLLHKDRRGGVYGCFDSHMKVWKDFMATGSKYCLIFEDDFCFEEKPKAMRKMLKKAETFIRTNDSRVDVLFLHNNYIPDDTNDLNDDCFENGFGASTHAYFITRRYIESILSKQGNRVSYLAQLPQGDHFDACINFIDTDEVFSKNVYFVRSRCFLQLRGSRSDNYTSAFDEMFRSEDPNECFETINYLFWVMKITTNMSYVDLKKVAHVFHILLNNQQ